MSRAAMSLDKFVLLGPPEIAVITLGRTGEDDAEVDTPAIVLRPLATPVFVASRILLMKFDFFGLAAEGETRPPIDAIPSS